MRKKNLTILSSNYEMSRLKNVETKAKSDT